MNTPITHPAILDALSSFQKQRVTRRQFIQFASILGLSTKGIEKLLRNPSSASATLSTSANPHSAIPYGGTWKSAMQLDYLDIDHPARFYSREGANLLQQVGECLTETGKDFVTRPQLLQRWEASEDLKTWTLYIREDVFFNNGDQLTADDVLFTFGEWLNPDVGSAMAGILSYLGGIQNVEKIDGFTIRLHLNEPSLTVPEDLGYYPAIILHHSFEGDFLKQPIGTGPFNLTEYLKRERAEFVRRPDYWRKDINGNVLPYLDRLVFVSLDQDDALTALQSAQIDTIYQPRIEDWLAMHEQPTVSIQWVQTASVFLGKMRVDLEPWNDNRVRTAFKLCQDRLYINKVAYHGQGELGIDAHIAPCYPDYSPKPIPTYNPEKARALLENYAQEKGISLPLKVTLATKNDSQEPQIAQALKELAEPAGFEITLDITDAGGYWDRWTEVPLGITNWVQRNDSLSTLKLAYTADKDGAPVSWNETRWVDPEFVEQLDIASRTLDIEQRQTTMSRMQDIMQERGPVFVSFWNSTWNITRSEFKNIKAHPMNLDRLASVWKEEPKKSYLPLVTR